MDLNEVMQHIKDGVATEEEKAYAKQQLNSIVNFIDDDSRMTKAPIDEPDKAEVKKAKKSFKWRYVFVPVLVIVIAVFAVGVVLSGVFGYAASSASKAVKFNRADCLNLAEDTAIEKVLEQQIIQKYISDGKLAPETISASGEIDHRKFNYDEDKIGDSYYSYIVEVDVKAMAGFVEIEYEVKLTVDTRDGSCRVLQLKID